MKNNKKAYLQISFTWIFAIVVGLFILFLAIYASTKIIGVGQTQIDAETAKKIEVLMNPIETGVESLDKPGPIIVPSETRIYPGCEENGVFGMQTIEISQKSLGKWTKTNIEVSFANKHIFAEEYVEGKRFSFFSKPFNFPFKVADIIILTSNSNNYCFIDAPEEIKSEIAPKNFENIKFENCSNVKEDNWKKVCFLRGSDCDIKVKRNSNTYDESSGSVEKDGKIMYFTSDSLMYGAIFSEPDIYECQIKRLMKRIEQLSWLYENKARIISQEGCNSNLNTELITLGNSAKSLQSSIGLESLWKTALEIKNKNEVASCRLF